MFNSTFACFSPTLFIFYKIHDIPSNCKNITFLANITKERLTCVFVGDYFQLDMMC